MTVADYKHWIEGIHFGKRLPEALYVHRDGIDSLDPALQDAINKIAGEHSLGNEFNLLKLRVREPKISFLAYPAFSEDAHPSLEKAVTIDLLTGKTRTTDYRGNPNPPILHRKESFLPPDNPNRTQFERLTRQEVAAGLYEQTATIGFKLNWERLLAAKGLRIEGHELCKAEPASPPDEPAPQPAIDRHKTALTRYDLSKPVKSLLEHGILKKGTSVFDYGCGLGADVKGLQALGYDVEGWDPQHRPETARREADIVNMGYVLNVIEDPAERLEALCDAFSFAKKLLIVSGLITETVPAHRATVYGDGVLTNRNTFQKYFEQQELQQYIEDALECQAVPVAMGIFYVFRDPAEHQQFLLSRSRRTIDWADINAKLQFVRPPPGAGRISAWQRIYDAHKDLVEDFWNSALQLGRLPDFTEYGRSAELVEHIGSPKRTLGLLLKQGRQAALDQARAIRKTDLLVYLASSNLRRRVPFKHLPASVRFDVRAFFGDYRSGLAKGLELLYSVGDADELAIGCEESKVGWQDEQALYVHNGVINQLPPILRAYIACGETLYGDAGQADLIKIHKASGKITFLVYDDFDGKPLPKLQHRIKVNLRTGWVQVFDHSAEQQLLFYKGRFGDPTDQASQAKLNSALRILRIPESTFLGPTRAEFITMVAAKGTKSRALGAF